MSNENQAPGVNSAYVKYDKMTPVELVRAMYNLRQQKDAMEADLKVITAEFDFLRGVKIPSKFEDEGISLLKVEGIGRCNLTGDLQATIPADKKEAAFQFLRDTGREDLIQETVNSSTLKAAVKNMIQTNQDIPDCFRVHTFTRASITKTS